MTPKPVEIECPELDQLMPRCRTEYEAWWTANRAAFSKNDWRLHGALRMAEEDLKAVTDESRAVFSRHVLPLCAPGEWRPTRCDRWGDQILGLDHSFLDHGNWFVRVGSRGPRRWSTRPPGAAANPSLSFSRDLAANERGRARHRHRDDGIT